MDQLAWRSCQWSSPVETAGRESPQTVSTVSPVKTDAPRSAGSTLKAAPLTGPYTLPGPRDPEP
ncbi:hypothetical protein EYF80_058583 [Liparis tanakae]|uniref:Uncharacterized protein n=1 Tax=Liparis tanakae TaxID=230148 RepID=A0A4Z2EQT3_9TELE|nr:hypothetical protein EYF80_058583 [Liparis tanakae]